MEMKQFTRLSLLLALSIVLNILESFIPIFNGYIPGLKLGLANVVSLFILYEFKLKDALYVGFLRVFLVGILRHGLFNYHFFFSLSGVLFSIIMMSLAKKVFNLSIIGVSIVGSLFHSIGQILIAILLLKTPAVFYYLPWLLLFSIPTGIIVGSICKQLLKYYDEHLIN